MDLTVVVAVPQGPVGDALWKSQEVSDAGHYEWRWTSPWWHLWRRTGRWWWVRHITLLEAAREQGDMNPSIMGALSERNAILDDIPFKEGTQ